MEFSVVWQRWLQCFRDAGMSWIDDMPAGVPEDELLSKAAELPGEPVPGEVLDLYRWSRLGSGVGIFVGGYGPAFSFDDMLTRSESESDLPYLQSPGEEPGFPLDPIDIVNLTGEGRFLFVDRSGPTIGRVWSWDSDLVTEGPSFTDFVATQIAKVEAEIYVLERDKSRWVWNSPRR